MAAGAARRGHGRASLATALPPRQPRPPPQRACNAPAAPVVPRPRLPSGLLAVPLAQQEATRPSSASAAARGPSGRAKGLEQAMLGEPRAWRGRPAAAGAHARCGGSGESRRAAVTPDLRNVASPSPHTTSPLPTPLLAPHNAALRAGTTQLCPLGS